MSYYSDGTHQDSLHSNNYDRSERRSLPLQRTHKWAAQPILGRQIFDRPQWTSGPGRQRPRLIPRPPGSDSLASNGWIATRPREGDKSRAISYIGVSNNCIICRAQWLRKPGGGVDPTGSRRQIIWYVTPPSYTCDPRRLRWPFNTLRA